MKFFRVREETSETLGSHIISTLGLWKERGKTVTISVHGDSMRPLIIPGDRLTIRIVDLDTVKAGDIVGFFQDSVIIVHRLIRKREYADGVYFCEKGDNLSGWGWHRGDTFLGKVERITGAGGRTIDLASCLDSKTGMNHTTLLVIQCWISVYECLYRAGQKLAGEGIRERMGSVLRPLVKVVNMIIRILMMKSARLKR